MNPARRLAAGVRIILALAGWAVLSGCSLVGLAYNNAGWFVEREASQYVAMDETQRERFRRAFDLAHASHRRQALGDYVLALEAFDQRLAAPGLSPAEAGCLAQVGLSVYRDLADRLVPVAAELLVDLRPAQLDQLEKAFTERNQDFAQRYLLDSPDARAKRRAERAAERLTKWVGPLQESQRQLLQDLSRQMPDTGPGWAAYRQHQQRALLGALRQGAGRARVEALLRAWWVEREGMTPNYEAAVAELVRGLVAGAVRFEGTLELEQRRHLRDRLRELAEGLNAVADGPGQGTVLPVADGRLACAPEAESLSP